MELLGIQVIESKDLPTDEAWIIFSNDAPQIPQNLKGALPLPCILAGNANQVKRTLNLLRVISLREPKSNARNKVAVAGRAAKV